ncbi:hypothetical protein [Kordia jejudonensis]|nr:hypothetical protein [Kordia jejudonensis]
MSYTHFDDEDDFSNFTRSGTSETSKSPAESPILPSEKQSEEEEEV